MAGRGNWRAGEEARKKGSGIVGCVEDAVIGI